jgi:hypothetical protein
VGGAEEASAEEWRIPVNYGRLATAAMGVALMHTVWAGGTLKHDEGKSLSYVLDGKTLWTLNFVKDEGKPYFHPVCLSDGTVLTWLRPPDHPWHRALWLSWKFINKLNYWEEDKSGKSQGITDITDVKFEEGKDGSTKVVILLDYHPPVKASVLKERRTITITPPDKDGCYRMDWHMVLTAQAEDAVLDRTPLPAEKGPSFGGYAGLSFRTVQTMTAYQTLDSEGRQNMAGHGQHARWLDYSGIVDKAANKAAGIAMFDHPSNPRHPTPWYIIMSGTFGYFSPAFVFDKPCTIPAGQSLSLAYRVLIHPGRGDKETLEKEFQAFSALKLEAP